MTSPSTHSTASTSHASSHPHSSHAASHSSHTASPTSPEHSTAAPKHWRRRSSSSRCISSRLISLLLLLPAPAPLLGLLLHLVDPLEQPLGPDHLRAADPHHVVAGVLARLLAGSAQVVVIADDTLVPEADDGGLVTSVAGHPMVRHISSHSRLLRLFNFLCTTHSCGELVDGAGKLSQGQDQLLVRVDGDYVAIFVSPGN